MSTKLPTGSRHSARFQRRCSCPLVGRAGPCTKGVDAKLALPEIRAAQWFTRTVLSDVWLAATLAPPITRMPSGTPIVLDVEVVAPTAVETRLVVTAEEHQLGGFGNIIAGAILRNREQFAAPLLLDMFGVED